MIFMVVPLEQGVHNPQIMTRCPKGLENRDWVRTYSYNDISRLLLSSFRLHATARPHVQTSVFFVNKNVTFEKSHGKPFNRNAEILLDRKEQNNRKWVTNQKVGFLSFMMSCLHDYFFKSFCLSKSWGGGCKEQPKSESSISFLSPYWTKASWMMYSREKRQHNFYGEVISFYHFP